MMIRETDIERFFETLISGDRDGSRQIVREYLDTGVAAEDVIIELFWPTHEMVDRLFRTDKLTRLSHHYATRLLRVLLDQTTARLRFEAGNGRRVLAFCGPDEPDELAGQMAVDLLEHAGFHVKFAGGGVPRDEIMGQVHEERPDILVLFGTGPSDLPEIRQLIDTMREIGACQTTQIAVGGGVFNRAEGLAEEIGADLWAKNPLELAHLLIEEPQRRATANQRTVGRKRKAA
jgi:methanogenic corrinoid protein MtbC1